jgi:hypothetical protein
VYDVDIESLAAGFPPGMPVPPLLPAFGRWLAEQPYGSVGYLNCLAGEAVDLTISPSEEVALAMRERLGIFLTLPEGSDLALWDHGGAVPAVVNIDSEGEYRTVAPSLEAFLLGWSEQAADSGELNRDDDDEDEDSEPSRYAEFAAWLREQGVRAPDVPPAPDFGAWVDEVTQQAEDERAARFAALPPIVPTDPAVVSAAVRTLATTADPMLGRFVDEDQLIAYCASLGVDVRTVPGPDEFRSLARFDAGFELEFAYPWEYGNPTLRARFTDALQAEYLRARRRMFWSITLHTAWIPPAIGRVNPVRQPFAAFDGPLPWGVTFADTRDSLAVKLGPPTTTWSTVHHWNRPDLDRTLTVTYDDDDVFVGCVRLGIPPA